LRIIKTITSAYLLFIVLAAMKPLPFDLIKKCADVHIFRYERLLGSRYTLSSTTDGVTISATSTSPNLQPGDTLDIQGTANFNAVGMTSLNGSVGQYIVIRWLPGSVTATTNSGFGGVWSHVSYVKVLNMNSHNYAGIPVYFDEDVHDVIFENAKFINDAGSFSDKQAIKLASGNSNMNFNGSKSSTFYNIEFTSCNFRGFQNVTAMVFGGNSANSICTDIEIHNCTFDNIINTGHIAANAIGGTIFNYHIHHNSVDSVLYSVLGNEGSQGVHCGSFQIAGWGEINNNLFTNSYTNSLRLEPVRWTVMNYGNVDTAKVNIHDNLCMNQLSFSFCEISNNNSGPLLGNISSDTAHTIIKYNTVYSTVKESYNGDYHGCVVELFSPYVGVYDNAIIKPQRLQAFAPDAANSKYVVAFISGTPHGFDSAGNRQYAYALTAGFDSTFPGLTTASILKTTASSTSATSLFDFYDYPRPGGTSNTPGAIQAQSDAVPGTRQQQYRLIRKISRT
jgi:hypothetical protein